MLNMHNKMMNQDAQGANINHDMVLTVHSQLIHPICVSGAVFAAHFHTWPQSSYALYVTGSI